MATKNSPQTDALNVSRNAILMMREGRMLQQDVGNNHFSKKVNAMWKKAFYILEDNIQKSETVSNTVTFLMADGSLLAEQW